MSAPATTSIARMRRAYDLIAPAYPGVNGAMPSDVEAMAQRVMQLGGHAITLLDVGCGPGRHLAWFEAQGARCVGVDLSRSMLRYARRLVHGPVLQGDMRHLCFGAASFRAIWCCAALLHLPRTEAPAALHEFRRVLVPDGVCFVAVQEGSDERWERRRRYGAVERLFTRYRHGELAELLAAHGFQILEARSVDDGSVRWLQVLARGVDHRETPDVHPDSAAGRN